MNLQIQLKYHSPLILISMIIKLRLSFNFKVKKLNLAQ